MSERGWRENQLVVCICFAFKSPDNFLALHGTPSILEVDLKKSKESKFSVVYIDLIYLRDE